MLRHGVITVTPVIALLLIKCFTTEGNPITEQSKCEYTDIEKHLKTASELIEAFFRKLTNDMKELCKVSSWNSPLYWADCETRKSGEESVTRETAKPFDCSDIYRSGNHLDGAYEIWPNGELSTGPLRVYCDMVTDGGGWTVIQRRGDFGNLPNYFFRHWNDYKEGFGDVLKEFWLGNDNIYMLTNQRHCQLRVDLMSWDGDTDYVTYDKFRIEDESNMYKLRIGNVIDGDAGDALTELRGTKFSTRDKDNDRWPKSCAVDYKGAWWYKNCAESNLNGFQLPDTARSLKGTIWSTWENSWRSLKASAMKIRPANFQAKDKL